MSADQSISIVNESRRVHFCLPRQTDDEYEKGHHYFPFEFVLPKEIPHEYKGIYGRVEYFVEVVFNDTWSAKVLVRVLTTLVVPHDAEVKS